MRGQEARGEAALDVREIETFYGDLRVLKKVSLHLDESETVALFGPNGHGKSALLKTICGLLPPRSGSIRYHGQEIAGAATDKTVEMGLAYIPESRDLFTEMSVLENLRMGAYNRRARKKLSSNLDFVFSLFPRLSERKSQMASTLSGGEARMLAVGRGLMSDASLLLLDELSIGLSPLLKRVVYEAVRRIGNQMETTILIVEQEVDYPLKLANRVYLLRKGQIILERKASEMDKIQIEKAYF